MTATSNTPSIFLRIAGSLTALALIAPLACLAFISDQLVKTPFADPPLVLVTTLLTASGGAYLLFITLAQKLPDTRTNLAFLFIIGIALRITMALASPILEDDYHRYIWDGVVTSAGENPYRVAPLDVWTDPQLADLTPPHVHTLESINHPDLRTIYPPVAQLAFAAAHQLQPTLRETHDIQPADAIGLRTVFAAFDALALLAVALSLKKLRRPLALAAIYWCNPLLIQQTYGSVHMDIIPAALTALAVYLAIARRPIVCALALGLAIGAKTWPILIAPILVRPIIAKPKQVIPAALILIAVVVLCYAPIIGAGPTENSGPANYAERWHNNDAAFQLNIRAWENTLPHLDKPAWLADRYARATTVGLIVAFVCALALPPIRREHQFASRSLAIIAFAFFLSPTQMPWYYVWLIPLLAVCPVWALIAWTALLPLYYLHYDITWLPYLQHGLVAALLPIEYLVRRTRQTPEPQHTTA